MSKPELFKVNLPLKSHATYDEIYRWLEEHHASEQLVNIYFNEPAQVIVVLTERSTALLMKLSWR